MPDPGSQQALGSGQHLIDVHDHLRGELDQVRGLVEQVAAGQLTAAQARSALQELSLRQNNWTLGSYCAAYCRLVGTHHAIEDASVFPHLRRVEPGLGPVIDRLSAEHHVIHGLLEAVDRSLVTLVDDGSIDDVRAAVDALGNDLLAHLAYEEEQLVGPLSRHGFG